MPLLQFRLGLNGDCLASIPGRLHCSEAYSRLCWWLQVFEEDNTGFKRMDERKGQGSDDEGALSLVMIPSCCTIGCTMLAVQARCCPRPCALLTLVTLRELPGWPWCAALLPTQRPDLCSRRTCHRQPSGGCSPGEAGRAAEGWPQQHGLDQHRPGRRRQTAERESGQP